MKKRKKSIISLMIILIGIIGYLLLNRLRNEHIKQLDTEINPKQLALSEEKKHQIEHYAIEIVDEYPVVGYAMVVIKNELIAHDQHKRYLVEVNAVGVNGQIESDWYTYYIVIQENKAGNFYVLPFGVEIFKSDIDPLKREIIISMMKVVNGWGNSEEEFEERWSKVLTPEGQASDKVSKSRSELNLKTIYYLQGVLKYMNEYLTQYQKAVEYNDMTYVKDFLKDVPGFYETQKREMEFLREAKVSREVQKIEIVEVKPSNKLQNCLVEVKMEMRNYINDTIIDTISYMEYQIETHKNQLEIIEVREEKK